MGVVYRYIDLNDNRIKYVGIVWSGNRTLKQRIEEKELNSEYVYEYRVLNSHMSEEETNKFLMEMMSDNSRYIYCHEHKEKEIENEEF